MIELVLPNSYDELKLIVGPENFTCDSDVLKSYASDLSFMPHCRPHAVVWPTDTKVVQETVLWANQNKIALIPVSSGEPRFRGDTIPNVGGVVVNLGKMNKIIRINKRNRVAVIEPGVTFNKIQQELAREGLRLITPLKPKKNKSVLGSILEREPTLAPRYHWDISDPLCCLEVIFGNGELFRTGEAAGPTGPEHQWKIGGAQKFPNGPHQLDYHRLVQGSQGSMGIATWASVKCELLPSVSTLYFVPVKDVTALYDFTYEVNAKYLTEEIFIANASVIASLIGKTTEEVKSLRMNLPNWTVILIINGFERCPNERVEYQVEDIHRIAQNNKVVPVKMLKGVGSGKMLKVIRDLTDENNYRNTCKGGCKEVFFIAPLNKSDKFINIVNKIAEQAGFPVNDIGVYIQPIVQGTSCHIEFQFYYDPKNPNELEMIKDLSETALRKLVGEGAFFSRPYPEWANEVYRNRSDIAVHLRKIKSILDPGNIMNPGKLCFA